MTILWLFIRCQTNYQSNQQRESTRRARVGSPATAETGEARVKGSPGTCIMQATKVNAEGMFEYVPLKTAD